MLKTIFGVSMLMCAVGAVAQTTPPACSSMTLGTNGSLNGFVPSPNDAWHQDISASPIDPTSAKIIGAVGDLGGSSLHPDFSSIADGGYGIPYTVVDSTVTPNIIVPVLVYPAESDIAAVPVPGTLPVESNPGECPTTSNDRHAIVIDRNKCVAYELYQAAHCTSGWTAAQESIWDFTTTEQRPYTYTSADAAGLSVFEGLIRYDEIIAGSINHAIRFTAAKTKSDAHIGYFTAPATHAAGNLSTSDNIMGMRIRLKASYDISKFSSTNQIILKAMKQYGMILADNGSNMFFQGTPDARWNDSDLNALKTVPSSAFDVIQMGPIYESTTVPKGAAPAITSFTASATSVASGTKVTLTPTVTGASYSYIDSIGFIRGPVTVAPTTTTTYKLTSRNAFGTTSASVTVTVTKGTITPKLTFVPIYGETFGVAPFTVSASSASSGAITYSIASGPATVSGNAVTLTGSGTVVVQANQAAAGTYTAASAVMSIPIKPGSPSLAFVPVPTVSYGTAAFPIAATTKSAGSISYSVTSGQATISDGNMVTVTGLGTVNLWASQAASGSYAAATAYTAFHVTAEAVTITFAPIPPETLGNPPFTVSATSNSPAPITYTIAGGPATVSGNTVTLTNSGTVSLRARQLAQGDYAQAETTITFTVAPRTMAVK